MFQASDQDSIQKMNLKTIFPKGSNDFINLNTGLQPPFPEPSNADALERVSTRKTQSLGRVTLRFKGCFVRLKDPDNFAGSLKHIIDGVRRCGLVDDDSPDKIKLVCEQEKVNHISEEHLELKIIYPLKQ